MNQEQTTQTDIPVNQKRNRKLAKSIYGPILILLLLAVVGYGVYSWEQISNLQKDLNNERSKNLSLTDDNSQLKNSISSTSPATQPQLVSTTLPNGKNISFPLTDINSQIIWWQDAGGNVLLSDKNVLSYVSSIPSETRKKICNPDSVSDFRGQDIAMGIFDTNKKVLLHNQYANCLQAMAAPTINNDDKSRAAAQAVSEQVNNDLAQFIKSATIK